MPMKIDHRGTIITHLIQFSRFLEPTFSSMHYCGQVADVSADGTLIDGTWFLVDSNCQDCIRRYYALERADERNR